MHLLEEGAEETVLKKEAADASMQDAVAFERLSAGLG